MKLQFEKYQATGNDFILIDNRSGNFPANDRKLVSRLCHRHFGIGSDGLILLEESAGADFRMDFINPDGSRSFCGNGSRAAMHFAARLGLTGSEGTFLAIDGRHQGRLLPGGVEVSLGEAGLPEPRLNGWFIHTGSPHYIEVVDNVDEVDVPGRGRELRSHPVFGPEGTNVNFVERAGERTLKIRTYERGVENETLSCGTGVTAAALALGKPGETQILARGGELRVFFSREDEGFSGVRLAGPAKPVFAGTIDI